MKHRDWERKNSKLNDILINHMNQAFVICIKNDDHPVSLEKRKLYQVIPDTEAERHGQIRIIDESGEDYLYPNDYFVAIDLSGTTEQAIIEAA